MPTDTHWHKLLDVADHLVARAPALSNVLEQEATRRTAVSRAYYAAFNLARQAWESENEPVGRRDVHDALIHLLQDSQVSGHRKASRLLRDLRYLRVTADYAANGSIGASETAAAVQRARNANRFMGQ